VHLQAVYFSDINERVAPLERR